MARIIWSELWAKIFDKHEQKTKEYVCAVVKDASLNKDIMSQLETNKSFKKEICFFLF